MLRGAVIIFTGILSTIFLRARLAWWVLLHLLLNLTILIPILLNHNLHPRYKWFGMVFVIGGLITVGLSDMMNQKPEGCSMPHSPFNTSLAHGYSMALPPLTFTSSPLCDSDNSSSLHNVLLGDFLIFGSQIIVATQVLLPLITTWLSGA